MGNPDIQDLNQRATSLLALAGHIDCLVDGPKRHSTTRMGNWAGPNADDVRGKLKGWRTSCADVARQLRAEAHQCTLDAKELRDKKK